MKSKLLTDAKTSEADFDNYHQKTKKTRDKYFTHRENHPDVIKEGDLHFPVLDITKETFLSIAKIYIDIAKKFPSSPSGEQKHFFIYHDVEKRQIPEFIKTSMPEL